MYIHTVSRPLKNVKALCKWKGGLVGDGALDVFGT